MDRIIRECCRRAPAIHAGQNLNAGGPTVPPVALNGLAPAAQGALAPQPAGVHGAVRRVLDWARNLRPRPVAQAAQVPVLPPLVVAQHIPIQVLPPQATPQLHLPAHILPQEASPHYSYEAQQPVHVPLISRDEDSKDTKSPDAEAFFASVPSKPLHDRKMSLTPPYSPVRSEAQPDDEPEESVYGSILKSVRQFQPAPDHQTHLQAVALEELEPGTHLTLQTGSRSYPIQWKRYDAEKDVAIFRMATQEFDIAGQFTREPGSGKYLYWMPLYGDQQYGKAEFSLQGSKEPL